MQKDSAQAKILSKVVGGGYFFDSPCICLSKFRRLLQDVLVSLKLSALRLCLSAPCTVGLQEHLLTSCTYFLDELS